MKMEWNLRVLMAKHHIASATELMRRLDVVGVQLSTSQASRIVKEMPNRLSVPLIRGILAVFRCDISDLIIVKHDVLDDEKVQPINQKPIPAKQVVRRTKQHVAKPKEKPSITGPNIRTFPVKGDD